MRENNTMSGPNPKTTLLIASGAHALAGQTYGGKPYGQHLQEVAHILRSVGFSNEDGQRAAFLHDLLEDTEWTSKMLMEVGFSEEVVAAVQFCTDAEGENRKARKAATYKRVREALDSNSFGAAMGVVVKWADRLANLRACARDNNKGLMKMYRKEAATFLTAYMPPKDMVLGEVFG